MLFEQYSHIEEVMAPLYRNRESGTLGINKQFATDEDIKDLQCQVSRFKW